MGIDKGHINYHGKPQQEHLFDLLTKFCDMVFTSCVERQDISPTLNPIYDKFTFESPLNGILSAFELHPHKAWFTVAVDMPFVNDRVLEFLVENRDTTKVATCFYDSAGKLPEPLLTIWEPSSFSLLMKFNQRGGISPRDFLVAHNCKKIISTESKVHVNINTPDDFLKLKN